MNELREVSSYNGGYSGFRKLLKRCEDDGLIKSFSHHFYNKKFIYLTRDATKDLSDEPYGVNESIKYHDAITSNLLFNFLKCDNVKDVFVRSQDINLSSKIVGRSVDIDGLVDIILDNKILYLAVEVELNRKSKDKIFDKFSAYHSNSSYGASIYFFNQENIMNSYISYYKEFCELKKLEEMIFFSTCENMTADDISIKDMTIWNMESAKSTIGDIFL